MHGSSKAYGPNLIRNGEFEFGFTLWDARENISLGTHESGDIRAEFGRGYTGVLGQVVPEFSRGGRFRASFRAGLVGGPIREPVKLIVVFGTSNFAAVIRPGPPTVWTVETDVIPYPPPAPPGQEFYINSEQPAFHVTWVDSVVVEEVLADPLIRNGDFSAGDEHWTLIDAKVADEHAVLDAHIEGSIAQDITLPGPGKYLLTFDVSSSKDERRYGEIDIVRKGQGSRPHIIWYTIGGTEPTRIACVLDTKTPGWPNEISIAIATHSSDAETIIDNVALVKL